MKSVHLVVPDLFLPHEIAGNAYSGLHLPVLENMLSRGQSSFSRRSVGTGLLEGVLSERFGLASAGDAWSGDTPVAAISAAFDRLGEGCWLRADPVSLHLDRSRMLLSVPQVTSEEASICCRALNVHFAGQGMTFFTPHPQRWYIRLDALPNIRTTPLSQVIGGDVRGSLPTGEDATRWHSALNEIQMLLYSNPLNDVREARGELPINSVWLWGSGCTGDIALQANYDIVSSDEVLAEMFARSAGVAFAPWEARWQVKDGRQLLVWAGLRTALQRGDLAAWREALQEFEADYAKPLWRALRSGSIDRISVEVLVDEGVRQIELSRFDAWAFWRRTRALEKRSLV